MKSFARVLVAVDVSQPAHDAFDHALAISAQHGAGLVVVQAVPPDQPFSRQARAREALSTTLREKAEHAHVAFAERVQQGDPAEIILLHARALRPDLIVAGTHERSGIDRFRPVSVAQRLVTRAAVPVLVIPQRRHANGIQPFNHVAVAVDFSAASARAVEQAVGWANGPAGRITLFHVVPGFPAGAPPRLYRYGVAEYQDQLIRDARQRLRVVVPDSRGTWAAIDTRVLAGNVTAHIRSAAESMGADLLVIGVRTRSAVRRALFRSTATRLLGVSRIPLLAVPETTPVADREERAPLQLAA